MGEGEGGIEDGERLRAAERGNATGREGGSERKGAKVEDWEGGGRGREGGRGSEGEAELGRGRWIERARKR